MVIGPDTSEIPKPEDFDEIDALLRDAFDGQVEAERVRRLRAQGEMWWELAKRWEGVIAGYAALSRMRSPEGWACLCPVAVLPRFQHGAAAPDERAKRHYAFGARLVEEIALVAKVDENLRPRGRNFPKTVVAIGKARFFERAGFSLTRAQGLTSPYTDMDTLIARPGDDVPRETLEFPAAFQALA